MDAQEQFFRRLEPYVARVEEVANQIRRLPQTRARRHGKATDSISFAGPDQTHGHEEDPSAPSVERLIKLVEQFFNEVRTMAKGINNTVNHTMSNNKPDTTTATIDPRPTISGTASPVPATRTQENNAADRVEAGAHTPDEGTTAPGRGQSAAAHSDGQADQGTEQTDATQGRRDEPSGQVDLSHAEPARAETTTAVGTAKYLSDPQWIPLGEENLGDALVPFIETLLSQQQNSGDGLRLLRLKIKEGIMQKMRLISDAMGKRQPRIDRNAVHAMEYWPSDEPGMVSLYELGSNFSFPDFAATPDRPTDSEIAACLDDLFSRREKHKVNHYVGKPITPHADGIIRPGRRILELPTIHGAQDYFWHAGVKHSGTPFHKEDANFRSINMVLYGFKLWIVIHEDSSARFEEFCRQQYREVGVCCPQDLSGHKTVDDDQLVRHRNCLIHPDRLHKEGISYDMFVAGPGDVVVTGRNQYHGVINVTSCFAISINFLPLWETPLQEEIWTCPDCGLYILGHEKVRQIPKKCKRCKSCGRFHLPVSTLRQAGARKRARAREQSRPAAKKKKLTAPAIPERLPTSAGPDNRMAEESAIQQDPFITPSPIRITTMDPLAHRIGLTVRCSLAVKNLAQLASMLRVGSVHAAPSYRVLSDPELSLGKLSELVTSYNTNSKISSVLDYISQIRFWRRIYEKLGDQMNMTPWAWGIIAQEMGVEDLEDSEKKQILKRRNTGRKLGGDLRGLISLIPSTPSPPCSIQLSDLTKLNEDQEAALLNCISRDKYSKALMECGEELVDMLVNGEEIYNEPRLDELDRAIADLKYHEVLWLVQQ
ncbi:hypothetical protein KVR01_002765 [Diaporthe batatas]|uniref:uncharacterized protein n=1 Tax=Diaporthe batatas TaxID=748121 RepID=UPI001D058453|nr:uncharacterized protein KVR01_002765 [Diaporthe batatas]KAG8167076.1 hypothetical protein KVR01_002765 [Diaporthe batatas]